MPALERSQWYDIARSTNWTPSFVTEEELFPKEMSDPHGVPDSEWETYDEKVRNGGSDDKDKR